MGPQPCRIKQARELAEKNPVVGKRAPQKLALQNGAGAASRLCVLTPRQAVGE